ncbi:MAG: tetratricopeptide repeat protein [SAR324 cluster bacterium]|nr:hypothetical protein [Deltaproteobacteria bacterium]MDP6464868.1 tetratricopeptide repeat protein [SAR324 cluster bacterium]
MNFCFRLIRLHESKPGKGNPGFQIHSLHWIQLLLVVLLFGACAKAGMTVRSPAEIDTRTIRNVAVGKFEVGLIQEKIRTERNGNWGSRTILLSEEQKEAISRAVRARVINLLGSTPYFQLNFSDEFAELENDGALQKLVSVQGYTTENIDAVINGKLWVDLERTDGVALTREDLEYFRPPNRYNQGMNLTVQQMVWWPYKSTRGTLGLEIKLTRLAPTEVAAVSFDTRTYAHRLGGQPADTIGQITEGLTRLRDSSSDKNKDLTNSDQVLIPFDQMIAELSRSVAASFVKKVAVTEKTVFYPVANGNLESARILIEEGAYELAIERLQQATASNPDPGDLYNLGLCFEAVGDYGLAINSYRAAWNADPENLLFAQGIGRIERLRRESPQLRRQLDSRR